MDLTVVKCSILSGIFASLASCFGKVGTTQSICAQIVHWFWDDFLGSADEHWFSDYRQYIIWTLQAFAFGAMIGSNGVMWSQFSLALAYSKFTLHVTAINTVTNFITTALIGKLLFAEAISIQWFLGIGLILFGIILLKKPDDQIKSSMRNQQQEETLKKKKQS